MTAYYNEPDPFAAAWLQSLMLAGAIAPGHIDTRSIEDVTPNDLRGFTQCHFFAGIGVWSHALRRAGWRDDKRVWTGSCPCQPFSAAGQGGGFDDQRHLWPAFFHLITTAKPDGTPVMGEQVASKDGLGWLDLVQTDMEAAQHTFGAVDICAAGVGAPNIRQRLYWFALDDTAGARRIGPVAGTEGIARHQARLRVPGERSINGVALGDAESQRRFGRPDHGDSGRGQHPLGQAGANGNGVGHGADASDFRFQGGAAEALQGTGRWDERDAAGRGSGGPSFWSDAEWVNCTDGKTRPIEPGTFPLAYGASARVGRLRGYGNALNAETATAFIEAIMPEISY